jgi:3-phenylpropionate/trans-cinnamate dioxygenase ferredoxin reductase subunit
MERFKHVILGGGMVAGYAAKEMVKQGVEAGEVCMISMDDTVPYQRPPLSKSFFLGEEELADILVSSPDSYEDNGIELRLNTWVRSVDLEAREISSKTLTVGYEKLLIATGAWPRELDLPGGKLQGVHYLRTATQSAQIKEAAAQAKRAVVVGAGFIGMELASGLTQLGVETALVFREAQVMAGRFPTEVAEFFAGYYQQQGVRLVPEAELASISGEERVTGVALSSGEEIEADMVAIAVGVAPEDGLFKGTPLESEDGIAANQYLETGVPDVYVAGDVARYQDVVFGRQRRFEHEDGARNQGKHVARVMLGEREPYVRVPYFYSDVFDLSWEYWGDRSLGERVVYRGEVQSGSFIAWWLREEEVVAAFALGRPHDEGKIIKQLIQDHGRVEPETLTDQSRPLADLQD